MADFTPEQQARYDVEAARVKAERDAAKAKAVEHLHESADDAIRTLRRIKKRDGDRESIKTDLASVRLSIKACDDALHRMGWS